LFTSREYDRESGLYFYRARYYDPSLGRFVSQDPIGITDDVNLYAYVGNNAINRVDPTGLTCEKKMLIINFEAGWRNYPSTLIKRERD